MITATKLRNGTNFVDNGEPWRVIDYKHTHLSRGAGTVRVKCKNLSSGTVLTKTYRGGDKLEEIYVSKKPLQYLYKDGEDYVFMDPETYEQLLLPSLLLDSAVNYLLEGSTIHVMMWEDKPLGVDIPPKMTFEVTEAAPGEKGDSASNVYKDAVIETGLKVRVPLFVNAGDSIRVDTRDGSYIERA